MSGTKTTAQEKEWLIKVAAGHSNEIGLGDLGALCRLGLIEPASQDRSFVLTDKGRAIVWAARQNSRKS